MSDHEFKAPLSPFSEIPLLKPRKGFASMGPEERRKIASKGGKTAQARGTGRRWTPEEARTAGRKGGQVSRGGRGRITYEEIAEQEGLLENPNRYSGSKE